MAVQIAVELCRTGRAAGPFDYVLAADPSGDDENGALVRAALGPEHAPGQRRACQPHRPRAAVSKLADAVQAPDASLPPWCLPQASKTACSPCATGAARARGWPGPTGRTVPGLPRVIPR